MPRIVFAAAVVTVWVLSWTPARGQDGAEGFRPVPVRAKETVRPPVSDRMVGPPAAYQSASRALQYDDSNGGNANEDGPRPPAVPGAVAPVPPVPPLPPGAVAPAAVPVAGGTPVLPGYPYLDASLHPTPQPHVPYQVGGSVITNQALYPHEMLYPHKYRALYPPYYYTVRGNWVITPWGIWSSEHWKLQGTQVNVNYRSKIHWLSGFHPPVIR